MKSDSEKKFPTEQERFWAGEFGDDYIDRNTSDRLLASNIALFSRILRGVDEISSVIEYGANVGMNLLALRQLLPDAAFSAVEINAKACVSLKRNLPGCVVHHSSILDFTPAGPYDLVIIKGVLIHQNPSDLEAVYKKLASTTGHYVVISEYYNPTPVAIDYRGHSNKLFKRDFAGEFLDSHPQFKLKDYGFVWRRDPLYPQDDVTWFLLERGGE